MKDTRKKHWKPSKQKAEVCKIKSYVGNHYYAYKTNKFHNVPILELENNFYLIFIILKQYKVNYSSAPSIHVKRGYSPKCTKMYDFDFYYKNTYMFATPVIGKKLQIN